MMKTVSLKLFFMLSLFIFSNHITLAAQQPTKPAGWGLHGMAVFGGEEGLYASHLPMFHAPHDVQLIFKFKIEDEKIQLELMRALKKNPELWTLVPEQFDIHRFAKQSQQPINKFKAKLVRGHFERGGMTRFEDQIVIVERVIVYRPLDTTPNEKTKGNYFLIGHKNEFFLLKEIDRRPDFDCIIAFQFAGEIANTEFAFHNQTIQFSHQQFIAPQLDDIVSKVHSLAHSTKNKPFNSNLIYFELNDLK